MTTLQISIIMTIHQEPDYRFTSDERKAAERMRKHGWLSPLSGNRCRSTKAGEFEYERTMPRALPPPLNELNRRITRGNR